jgi:hypothetical protein
MNATLSPMNLGGILDRAVLMLKSNFALFAGLAAFQGLTNLAFQLASVHPTMATDPTGTQIGLNVLSYAATAVVWVLDFAMGAIIPAAFCLAASRVLLGESITIRAAFSAFRPKVGRLVWLSFLQGLYAGWPLIIVIVISGTVAAEKGSLFIQIPIWVLGSIPCIALYTRCALACPATAVENLPASAAFDRGVKLGKGGRWRICWGLLLPGIAGAVLGSGPVLLIEQFKSQNAWLSARPLSVAALEGTITLLAGLVFAPLGSIVLTLLYYDQRIRREGYDIERMMDAAGMSSPQPAPETSAPPALAQPPREAEA